MANEVYANTRELSCKAGSGKSICAFPDVCFTPPENPATPPGVPIPYPNTGMTSDTTSGSKSVKITGKEVMLKNKSYFKTSYGDEAGCAAKKGILTSVNKGKVYFNSWSMDVKIEKENAVRHFDLTTHNHNPPIGDTPTWPFTDRMNMADVPECAGVRKAVEDNCKQNPDGSVDCPCADKAAAVDATKKVPGADEDRVSADARKAEQTECFNDYSKCMNDDECQKAARCLLTPKDPSKCCPGQTPHHVVPASQFKDAKKFKRKKIKKGNRIGKFKKVRQPANQDVAGYKYNAAPCVCVEGNNQAQGSHADIHEKTVDLTLEKVGADEKGEVRKNARWPLKDAEEVGAQAMKEVFDCDPACTKAQLRNEHEKMDCKENANVRVTTPGPGDPEPDDSDT